MQLLELGQRDITIVLDHGPNQLAGKKVCCLWTMMPSLARLGTSLEKVSVQRSDVSCDAAALLCDMVSAGGRAV